MTILVTKPYDDDKRHDIIITRAAFSTSAYYYNITYSVRFQSRKRNDARPRRRDDNNTVCVRR